MQGSDIRPDINTTDLPNQSAAYVEGGYHPTSTLMSLSDAVGDAMKPQLDKMYENQLATRNVQITGDATQAAETAYRNILATNDPSDPNNHAKLNQQMSQWWSNYQTGLTQDEVNMSSEYVNKINLGKQSEMVNYGTQYSNSQLLASLDKQQNDILKLSASAPPEMKSVYMDQLDKLREQAVSIGAMTPEQAAQHEIQGKSDYDLNRAAAVAVNNPAAAMHMVQNSSDITPERKLTMVENLQHEERQRVFEARQNDMLASESYRIGIQTDPGSIRPDQIAQDKNISSAGKAQLMVDLNRKLMSVGGTDQQQSTFQDALQSGNIDPNDKKQQLAANYYYNQMIKNPNVSSEQKLVVPLKTGYIPESMQAEMLTAQASNDTKRISGAAQMLSQISSARPDALRFMDADPQAKSFLMNVAHMSAGGVDPDQAISAARQLQTENKSESDMKKLYKESVDYSTRYGPSVISDEGNPISRIFNAPQSGGQNVDQFIQSQLQSSYMEHRATGATKEAANRIAQSDVAPLVGLSDVNGPNRVEILPPEKFSKLPAEDIRNNLLEVIRRADPNINDVSIVADANTLQEYKAKQQPTYQAFYKDSRTGAIIPTPGRVNADGRPVK